MYIISFNDDSSIYKAREITVKLKPDQSLNPFTWKPPILWDGFIDNTPVTIIQTERHALSINAFDWSGIPEAYYYLRNKIVAAIDKVMRTMD